MAILALGAIAYGLWNDAREQQAETEYIELPAASDAGSESAEGAGDVSAESE